uniref:Uncharacterized protein n=1 Tax=Myotis myotis TaxID=51298 RepID=A0A7J7WVM1_MYOMY|nr:hypothetical protein mMyoMyo1_011880 [Myotis myotis]
MPFLGLRCHSPAAALLTAGGPWPAPLQASANPKGAASPSFAIPLRRHQLVDPSLQGPALCLNWENSEGPSQHHGPQQGQFGRHPLPPPVGPSPVLTAREQVSDIWSQSLLPGISPAPSSWELPVVLRMKPDMLISRKALHGLLICPSTLLPPPPPSSHPSHTGPCAHHPHLTVDTSPPRSHLQRGCPKASPPCTGSSHAFTLLCCSSQHLSLTWYQILV